VAPFRVGETPCQHYNSVLTLAFLHELADAVVVFSNEDLSNALAPAPERSGPGVGPASNAEKDSHFLPGPTPRGAYAQLNRYVGSTCADLFAPLPPAHGPASPPSASGQEWARRVPLVAENPDPDIDTDPDRKAGREQGPCSKGKETPKDEKRSAGGWCAVQLPQRATDGGRLCAALCPGPLRFLEVWSSAGLPRRSVRQPRGVPGEQWLEQCAALTQAVPRFGDDGLQLKCLAARVIARGASVHLLHPPPWAGPAPALAAAERHPALATCVGWQLLTRCERAWPTVAYLPPLPGLFAALLGSSGTLGSGSTSSLRSAQVPSADAPRPNSPFYSLQSPLWTASLPPASHAGNSTGSGRAGREREKVSLLWAANRGRVADFLSFALSRAEAMYHAQASRLSRTGVW
jgi:hypothetical protein